MGNEDVAVGEEQNPLLCTSLPEPPDDLKRCVGRASPRRHDEQQPITAFCDFLDHTVDGQCLIVSRCFTGAVIKIVLVDDMVLSGRDTRSEEHTSELQSIMRISYAVFCLKKKIYKVVQRIRGLLLTLELASRTNS